MEFSKSICENLKKIYPNDTYVAYDSAAHGDYDHVFYVKESDKPRVMRLRPSAAGSVNNSALESLLHKVVFDSRGITENENRAIHIWNNIKKMLPGTNATVIVTNSNDLQIFGSTKGVANYWETEFGSHVGVILS